MVSKIGDFYNARGVVVGQAVGFWAPADTPLPADSISPFDPAVWLSNTVALGTPTAGTFTLTASGGPLSVPVTTAPIAFGALFSAVASALNVVLPVGYVASASGMAPNFVVSIDGPASDDIVLTGSGAALTPVVVPNLAAPSPWNSCGGTEQGWSMSYAPTVNDINIEEQPTAVGQQVTSAKLEFSASLSEDTVDSLQLALSATAAVQVATVPLFGKTTLTLQPTLPTLAFAVEVANRYGFPRRYYVPQGTVAANVTQAFRRAASQRLVPVTFSSTCSIDAIKIVEITANHL